MQSSKQILLIEDDEFDVISVQRSIKKLDMDIELQTAYNGVEALSLLRKTNNEGLRYLPDIIILDLNMPKMNGVEFLREIRKNNELKGVKVFVMTTSGESADRKEMEHLGVAGYLIKPMNFTENTKHRSSMDAFMQFHILNILKD